MRTLTPAPLPQGERFKRNGGRGFVAVRTLTPAPLPQGEGFQLRAFERLVPDRQGIEIRRYALAFALGRLHGAMALGGKTEFLQGFRIQL